MNCLKMLFIVINLKSCKTGTVCTGLHALTADMKLHVLFSLYKNWWTKVEMLSSINTLQHFKLKY